MKICPQCGKEYKDTTTLCPSDGTVLKKEADLVGQTLADKYRVDEFLSEGGMGTVYRGTHILMDKTVAIKVLHPALAADDTIVARFSREARAASRISHPHALNVTDFGESKDGVVFLVMEFLNGRTLKEIVRSEGPMPLPRVVEIMRQVCGALEAAHAENVVHRDLKSDNIMLIDVGGGDWVKVLDFGIAKIQEPAGQDPELTAPNLIIGTPQYMSPEQCSQASEIDSRSDIYSLGVILYEMLAGHVPFTGESPTNIMMKHLQDAPLNITDERRDLPKEVGQVVARALAKRPEDRFQTANELAESLTLAAEKEVTSETPVGEATERIERDTHRIVVPTGSNEPPRTTLEDDYDEETVVRPSPAIVASHEEYEEDAIPAPPPPPATSSNSWKMAVIALIGVIVIGGVLYALTSRRPSTNEQQPPPLTVDPNGQPVQPAPPPTGHSEQGITPNAPVTNSNTSVNTNTSSTNQNQNSELPPATDNSNAEGNDNAQPNSNSSGNNNSSSNSNSNNKNTNQGIEPPPPPPHATPTKSEGDEPPPPPPPTPKKQPAPKPTAQSNGGATSQPPSSDNP